MRCKSYPSENMGQLYFQYLDYLYLSWLLLTIFSLLKITYLEHQSFIYTVNIEPLLCISYSSRFCDSKMNKTQFMSKRVPSLLWEKTSKTTVYTQYVLLSYLSGVLWGYTWNLKGWIRLQQLFRVGMGVPRRGDSTYTVKEMRVCVALRKQAFGKSEAWCPCAEKNKSWELCEEGENTWRR